jgi:hypothetical protein
MWLTTPQQEGNVSEPPAYIRQSITETGRKAARPNTSHIASLLYVSQHAWCTQCTFQLLSPNSIIILRSLTFGNITTYLHADLWALWTFLTDYCMQLTRVHRSCGVERQAWARGGDVAVNFWYTQFWSKLRTCHQVFVGYYIQGLSANNPRCAKNRRGRFREFEITAIYSNANWNWHSTRRTGQKVTTNCELETMTASVTITFSDQYACRHHLLNKQVSIARHIWKDVLS